MTFFVDLSNHDWSRGTMDLDAMLRDGISGGWHKVSDGLNYYVDPYYITFAARARTAGWPIIGGYHVLWGNRDIRGQAEWFLSLLDAKSPWWRDMASQGRFVLMSDDEPFGYNVKPTIDQVNGFGDALASLAGSNSIGYTPGWVYGSSVGSMRYSVVGSNYGSNPRTGYKAAYPGDASTRWGFHDTLLQYGSLLTVGSQASCDVNAFRGTLDQFISVNGGKTDMVAWSDPAMPGRLGGIYASADPILADLLSVINDRGSYYVTNAVIKPPLGYKLDAMQTGIAALAGLAAKLDAQTTLVQSVHDLITSAAGSPDLAGIISHIDDKAAELGAQETTTAQHIVVLQDAVSALHAENLDLRHRLAQSERDSANDIEPTAP